MTNSISVAHLRLQSNRASRSNFQVCARITAVLLQVILTVTHTIMFLQTEWLAVQNLAKVL